MKKKKTRNRVKLNKLVLFLGLFLFLIMIIRLVQLGLAKTIDGTNLQALASKRTTKTETIASKRGTVYTSDNEVLAQNVSSYKLIAYLSESRTTDKNNPQHVVEAKAEEPEEAPKEEKKAPAKKSAPKKAAKKAPAKKKAE